MSREEWNERHRIACRALEDIRADVREKNVNVEASTRARASDDADERARARAHRSSLIRRKFNRLSDALDVLDDLARARGIEREVEATRRCVCEDLRASARALREEANEQERRENETGNRGNDSTSSSSVVDAIGAHATRAVEVLGNAAGALATRAKEATGGDLAKATFAGKAENGASEDVREMSTEELLEYQTRAIKGQDDALEGLDNLVVRLKSTSMAIHKEVELQAKLVDDLEADFAHTSERMKQLRKQGFKLAGEKNEAERERLDRKEVLEEMQAKLKRDSGADDAGSCSIQ